MVRKMLLSVNFHFVFRYIESNWFENWEHFHLTQNTQHTHNTENKCIPPVYNPFLECRVHNWEFLNENYRRLFIEVYSYYMLLVFFFLHGAFKNGMSLITWQVQHTGTTSNRVHIWNLFSYINHIYTRMCAGLIRLRTYHTYKLFWWIFKYICTQEQQQNEMGDHIISITIVCLVSNQRPLHLISNDFNLKAFRTY